MGGRDGVGGGDPTTDEVMLHGESGSWDADDGWIHAEK